jgi:polyhydroxyalkanoate synthase
MASEKGRKRAAGGAAGGATKRAAAGGRARGEAATGKAASEQGSAMGAGPAGLQMPQVSIPAARMAELQAEYFAQCQALLSGAAAQAAPELKDKRFAGEAWRDKGAFNWTAAIYLLNAQFLQKMADAVEGDKQSRERVRFATQQWVDMLSPANFLATNPEVQRKLLETRGESLKTGIEQMVADLQRGQITQTDESAFEVGRNVATSPGAVVFQNDLFQLIQYAPSTPQVGARPLLMVPPCINKFYIMDLQPDNSLVAYAASQGHTVFMVSWKNVQADQGHLTWDDYLEQGIFEAIRVAREISGADQLNALGFCVGGTMLATGLAALAARGEKPVASLTLMTTLIEFSEPGMLGVFIDEPTVAYREQTLGGGGLLSGKDLAATFSFLRPNDLVWNYYVNNYLKGEQPPAFDLLYWNSDSTNLPGPYYAWYLRHLYLQNELRIPDRLTCAGQPIDLGRIDVPTFVFAAREDHIVPWHSAYEGARLLSNSVRFVLGASGHIAGAINPVSKNKRSYWVGEAPGAEPDQWLDTAVERPGSWWAEWAAWLAPFQGAKRAAPRSPGARGYAPIEPAPGSYVKMRA